MKNLAEVEANVISATERRDFSVAVTRQKAVDDARQILNETLAAEVLDDELVSTNIKLQFYNEDNKHILFTCRRELEIEIEVSMDNSTMDALSTMVENRYCHLPVADNSSAVVGMLNITKCLSDAISKLERSQDKNGSVTEDDV